MLERQTPPTTLTPPTPPLRRKQTKKKPYKITNDITKYVLSLEKKMITKAYIDKIKGLAKISKKRGQSVSQMALAWVLHKKQITSALIGSRTIKQLNECLDALNNLNFTKTELKKIDKFAKEEKINIWEPSSRY